MFFLESEIFPAVTVRHFDVCRFSLHFVSDLVYLFQGRLHYINALRKNKGG